MLTIHCRLSSRYALQQPCVTVSPRPQSARWFTAGRPLSGWNWSTMTSGKSKKAPAIRSQGSALSLKAIYSAKRKRNSRPRFLYKTWSWNERTAPKDRSHITSTPPEWLRRHAEQMREKAAVLKEAARKEAELRAYMEEVASKKAAAKKAAEETAAQAEASRVNGFYAILETGQPDLVMAALLRYDHEGLVAKMPPSIFIEALHALSPAYFVDPYKEIYKPLLPNSIHLRGLKAPKKIFDDFIRNLSAIVRTRRAAGHRLALAEYTHLLDCTRAVGDGYMADYIWHCMKRDRVEPNVQCYNHYMEARVWDHCNTGVEKFRLHISPYAYKKRRFENNAGWLGYGTAQRSVRSNVSWLFSEMVEAGHEGDEASIVNLMISYARVGDKWAMEGILNSVWNINTAALKQGGGGSVTPYARSSPFYPTARLLFAVAHAYGSISDITGAGRVLEHVSKSYNIEVPASVWAELFGWAYVSSRKRTGPNAFTRNYNFGADTFRYLFSTMTQAPFDVEPTVEMHRRLAQVERRSLRFRSFIYHLRCAYEILETTRRKKKAARKMVETYLLYARSNGVDMDQDIVNSKGFADAIHAFDILRHLVRQQTMLIESLIPPLVFFNRWLGRAVDVWERQMCLGFIEEWREFLPSSIILETTTGIYGLHDTRVSRSDLCRVRRPSINDEFTPTQDTADLDDESVLQAHHANMSTHDLSIPLIQRLFDGVLNDNAYDKEIDFETLEYNVLAHEARRSARLTGNSLGNPLEEEEDKEFFDPVKRFIHWAEADHTSDELKKAALLETFGAV